MTEKSCNFYTVKLSMKYSKTKEEKKDSDKNVYLCCFCKNAFFFFQKAKVGICSKYLPKVKRKNICTFEKKINVFPPKKEKLKNSYFWFHFLF